MIAPLIIYPVARYGFGMQSPITLYPIVFGTTIVWLIVTFLTKPTEKEVLVRFYRKVHPGGRGWKPIIRELPDVKSDSGFGKSFIDWICGVIMLYASLFGIGKLIFAEYFMGIIYIGIAIICAAVIYFHLSKIGWDSVTD
jgi:hypothetical protein